MDKKLSGRFTVISNDVAFMCIL